MVRRDARQPRCRGCLHDDKVLQQLPEPRDRGAPDLLQPRGRTLLQLLGRLLGLLGCLLGCLLLRVLPALLHLRKAMCVCVWVLQGAPEGAFSQHSLAWREGNPTP